MLKKIRIAQIGDVHFPSAGEESTENVAFDDKDKKFPPRVKNIIAKNPLKTVFRRIYDLMENDLFDAVLFMGDFTDTGKLPGYEACAKFIANALQLGDARKYGNLPLGIVPGNHDIDRVLAKNSPLERKFAPLNDALRNEDLPLLPMLAPISFNVSKQDVSTNIFLVNSCWGCGEEEFIPEYFRQPISAAIAATFTGQDGESARKLYYDRQLDTPAISQETISELVNQIDSLPNTHIAIIVGHHNLFPQRTPRLAPYTELVNSGALRRSLMEMRRPIIFLHGHIHEDPIEIISQPGGQPLIVISAPETKAGFNIIEFTFTSHSAPLVCSVTPYRFDNSHVLKIGEKIRIPLIGQRNRSTLRNFGEFYAELLRVRECYWDQIESIARQQLGLTNPDDVIEQLELLYSDGRIFIANYDLPFKNWIIRATI